MNLSVTTRRAAGFLFVAVLSVATAPSSYAASAVSKKLAGTAKKISADAKLPEGQQKPAVAVLPFNAASGLAKRNIGTAFTEMLTHHLVTAGKFRVIERIEQERLLQEQKFQMTGAVDSTTAVQMGKLIGARYVVLGSVEKMRRTYELNCRLTDVETGEVLSSAYEEFNAKEFEDEAKPFLQTVPERGKLGVFGVMGVYSKTDDLAPVSVVMEEQGGATSSHVIDPKPLDYRVYGVGLRYFPTRRLFIEAAYLAISLGDSAATVHQETVGAYGNNKSTVFKLTDDSSSRAMVGISQPITPRFSVRLAGGLRQTKLDASYNLWPAMLMYLLGTESQYVYSASLSETNPIVGFGLEYRIQERIQLSISGVYEMGDLDMKADLPGKPTILTLPKLAIEPSISIYF